MFNSIKDTFYIRQLGNIYNPNHSGSSFAGYVWDSKHIAPCLNTMSGGGRQPMIIERVENGLSERNS